MECFASSNYSPWIRKSTDLKHLAWSKEEVAQLLACCDEFWHLLEPQYARDKVLHSPELEWMHMVEKRPEAAATGSGRLGTDVTTLMVEPRSFVAAGDRLLVQPNSSCSTHTPTVSKSSNFLLEEPQQVERDNFQNNGS